jgi:DNA-binding beta-propeller fold protein YncE
MTTVGAGKYTYRLIQDWARLPKGESFGPVSAVAIDAEDRVYAFQQKDPPVHVFDRNGGHLRSWGNGAFVRPHGFYIAGDVAYLTDTDDSVVMKYTLDGRPLQVLGQRGVHSDTGTETYGALVGRAAGPFNHPTKLVPSPSGDLYVSDGERNARVHRFSGDGRLIASWGEPGKRKLGQFHMPHGILVGQDGRVYVCDRENACIQVFSPDGEPIARWTGIQSPCDVAVDRDGVFYVCQLAFNATHRYPGYPAPVGTGSAITDSKGRRTILPGGEPQVSVLDAGGKVLASWKSRSPHGVAVDSHGDVYIALSDGKQIDKYVRQG